MRIFFTLLHGGASAGLLKRKQARQRQKVDVALPDPEEATSLFEHGTEYQRSIVSSRGGDTLTASSIAKLPLSLQHPKVDDQPRVSADVKWTGGCEHLVTACTVRGRCMCTVFVSSVGERESLMFTRVAQQACWHRSRTDACFAMLRPRTSQRTC